MPPVCVERAARNSGQSGRPLTGPAKLDRTKDQVVSVKLRVATVRSAAEWYDDKELPVNDNTVTVDVPAGEVRIVEFVSE